MLDPIAALAFTLTENKGAYALLLGSGLSRAAQIPTGWEITLDLARKVALMRGADTQNDPERWYYQTYGCKPNYSDLLAELADTPDERRAILHRYIEPTEDDRQAGRKIPTAAHHAIARLVRDGFVRVIVTTNFDRLMEQALSMVGVEPQVIASVDALNGAVPLVHSRCYLLKLHGDYLDPRSKNTVEELADYAPEIDRALDRIIDDHGFILCGWSAEWDKALKAAFTRAPNRRYSFFWTSIGTPSQAADDLIKHRRGKVIPIEGADAFFTQLESYVSLLAQSQRPGPQSTALILAQTKKLLARAEDRIALGELVHDLHRTLLKTVSGPDYAPSAQWSCDAFQRRVAGYEAATEQLARVFGIMGYWGDGSEISLVSDLVRDLMARNNTDITSPELRHLATYPAVLVWYAYGLGLLAKERLKELEVWLNLPLPSNHDGQENVACFMFFPRFWSPDESQSGRIVNVDWFIFGDSHRQEAAMSEHLYCTLSPWMQDYAVSDEKVERTFQIFELFVMYYVVYFYRTKFGNKNSTKIGYNRESRNLDKNMIENELFKLFRKCNKNYHYLRSVFISISRGEGIISF